MGSVGDCFDNAMYESFFATLECELLDRRRFESQAEAKMAIFAYIEGWYNPHRRHSSIGYLYPSTTRGGYTQHAHNRCNARLESQAVNRPRNGVKSKPRQRTRSPRYLRRTPGLMDAHLARVPEFDNLVITDFEMVSARTVARRIARRGDI